MLLQCGRENANIVHERENVVETCQNAVHGMTERAWCSRKTEWRHAPLVQAKRRHERGLVSRVGCHRYLIVTAG